MGGVGAYSSRKGLSPGCGQCHQPRVGVPPLRLAGITGWAAPPNKKVQKTRLWKRKSDADILDPGKIEATSFLIGPRQLVSYR